MQHKQVGATVCSCCCCAVVASFVQFPSSVSQVEMQVAISFISAQQATINLQAEQANFDTTLANAQKVWSTFLNNVLVDANADQQDNVVQLYSAVYHSYMAPTLFSEVGGVYLGFDLKVHTCMSLPLGSCSVAHCGALD
jgi:putative alpha-1,2-mannosidase